MNCQPDQYSTLCFSANCTLPGLTVPVRQYNCTYCTTVSANCKYSVGPQNFAAWACSRYARDNVCFAREWFFPSIINLLCPLLHRCLVVLRRLCHTTYVAYKRDGERGSVTILLRSGYVLTVSLCDKFLCEAFGSLLGVDSTLSLFVFLFYLWLKQVLPASIENKKECSLVTSTA